MASNYDCVEVVALARHHQRYDWPESNLCCAAWDFKLMTSFDKLGFTRIAHDYSMSGPPAAQSTSVLDRPYRPSDVSWFYWRSNRLDSALLFANSDDSSGSVPLFTAGLQRCPHVGGHVDLEVYSNNQVLPDPQRPSGGEIHVLVTFSADVSEIPLDDLVLCIHLEVSSDQQVDARLSEEEGGQHTFSIGEIVVLPENVLSGGDGYAVWSRASRVNDAKMQHLSTSAQRRTVLFVVDKRNVFNKLWRDNDSITHPRHGRLVANIFLLRGIQQHQLGTTRQTTRSALGHSAVVLWQKASSDFVLDSSWFGSPPVSVLSGPGRLTDTNCREQDYFNSLPHTRQYGNPSVYIPCSSGNERCHINAFDVDDADPGYENISVDNGLWQRTTFANKMEFRVKCQYLLILWTLYTGIELRDVIFSANTISMYLGSRLKQVETAQRIQATAQLEDIADFFLQDIFDRVFIPPSSAKSSFYIGSAFQRTTIRLVVHLFLRALSSGVIHRLLHSAFQAGKHATSKEQFQRLFISLVVDVYGALGVLFNEVGSDSDLLAEGDQSAASLPSLVDDVISLVYGHKRFAAMRPKILGLFKCQQYPQILISAVNGVFQAFTAQVRETIIASVTSQPQHRCSDSRCNGNRHHCQSDRKCRWLLEPGSVQARDMSDRDVLGSIKIADIAQFVREFGCTDLGIGDTAASLSLLSVFSFSNNTLVSPMKLVFDGRFRVFRVLPTGVSSMITTVGGWSIGDYKGSLSGDKQSFDVDFFAYKEVAKVRGLMTDGKATAVRRISLSFTSEKKDGSIPQLDELYNSSNTFAIVDGIVFGSIYTRNGRQNLHEITSTDRGEIWKDLQWAPLMKIRVEFAVIVDKASK